MDLTALSNRREITVIKTVAHGKGGVRRKRHDLA
jgi:hypothetical protein